MAKSTISVLAVLMIKTAISEWGNGYTIDEKTKGYSFANQSHGAEAKLSQLKSYNAVHVEQKAQSYPSTN